MSGPPVVIFMTSNGVGMGHLSRQLTLALSNPGRTGSVIFSLSGALPRIMAADSSGELPEAAPHALRYEYCPSRESGWLPQGGWKQSLRQNYRSYRWHPYLRDRLVALVAETGASAVVFDGVVPYQGLMAARRLMPDVAFVWVRRGMWRADAVTHRLGRSSEFDLVLQPGDVGCAADRGPLADRDDACGIPPVSLLDVLSTCDREASRDALGLPRDRPVLLLAPGSGALGSVDEIAMRVQREVQARGPEWLIAVTRQSIAQHRIGDDSGSTVVLDDVYPLARYLSAFDAAVSAAGYNAVHELLGARVPTLLVPSVHHVTDDQAARAEGVRRRDAALVCLGEALEPAVAELLQPEIRARLSAACSSLEPASGGRLASQLIDQQVGVGSPGTVPMPSTRPRRPWVDARTPVRTDAGGIRFSEDISVADVRGPVPVEHLVRGSSEPYRRTRRQTAGWLYRPSARARSSR